MMASANEEIVSHVYRWVISDVIDKVSMDFAHLGIDESILNELQQSWEQKLLATNVVSIPVDNPHAISSYYQDNDEYDYVQNTHQDPRMSGYPPHINPYLQQQSTQHQHYPSGQSSRGITPVAGELSGYYHLNQTDGSQEAISSSNKPTIELEIDMDQAKAFFNNKKSSKINQLDGVDDDEDDDDDLDDNDESNIGSDLDDDTSDEEVETDHIILCQYEKVSRIKNKWKAMLRDGVMTVNGKDYLFNKANGDFEW